MIQEQGIMKDTCGYKTLMILREQRLRCFKQKKDVTKIDDTIKLIQGLKDNKKTLNKSLLMKIISEVMLISNECTEVRVNLEEIDNILGYLFKEYL